MQHPALRASTLMEMVLASALFGVLALILSLLIKSQLRISTRMQQRISLEQDHLRLQESLRHDVVETTAVGISLDPGGQKLALQNVVDVTAQGEMVYDTGRLTAYLYFPLEKTLQRRVWMTPLPIALKTPAENVTPAQWLQLEQSAQGKKMLWKGLEEFQIRTESGSYLSPRLWVDCRWVQNTRQWSTQYCFNSRQTP